MKKVRKNIIKVGSALVGLAFISSPISIALIKQNQTQNESLTNGRNETSSPNEEANENINDNNNTPNIPNDGTHGSNDENMIGDNESDSTEGNTNKPEDIVTLPGESDTNKPGDSNIVDNGDKTEGNEIVSPDNDNVNNTLPSNNKGLVSSPKFIDGTSINFDGKVSPDLSSSGSFISVPNGVVFAHNGGKEISSYDLSGRRLWTTGVQSGIGTTSVKGMEYNSKYDSLVVIYGGSYSEYQIPQLYIQVFENISEKEEIIEPTWSQRMYIPPLGTEYFNAWGLTPIYNENSEVTEYIIYNKFYKGNTLKEEFFATYHLKLSQNAHDKKISPSITKKELKFSNDVRTPWYRQAMIYSVSAFTFNGKYYIIPSYVSTTEKEVSSLATIKFSLYEDWQLKQTVATEIPANTMKAASMMNDPNMAASQMMNFTPSTTGYSYDSTTGKMNIFFLYNFKGEELYNPHWKNSTDALLLNLVLDTKDGKINIVENEWLAYPIWSYEKDNTYYNFADRVVKYGRFENTTIEKHGIKNDDYSSSLTMIGYKTGLDKDRQKMIALVDLEKLTKERTNGQIYYKDLVVENDTPSNREHMKLFKMGINENMTVEGASTYTDPYRSWNNRPDNPTGNFGVSESLNFGLSVLRYDANENNPFSKNLIYTKNGLSSFSVFNTSNLDKGDEVATYGYSTTIAGDLDNVDMALNWGRPDVEIDKVTDEFLNEYLETAEGTVSSYLQNIKFIDLPQNSKLFVKVEDIVSSKESGSEDILKVSVHSSFYFDRDGHLKKNDNVNYNSSNANDYKIGTIYIKGFKPKN